MRIVILGTRGVPASYGGFETFAEQLSTRLVARGHEVTVYCRAHYVSPRQIEYKGVRLKVLPTIRHKYFDTIVHTGLSAFHAAAVRRFDAALICNAEGREARVDDGVEILVADGRKDLEAYALVLNLS